MATTPAPIFRPVTAADKKFLFELYASERAEELATTQWGPTQRAAFLQSQFETRLNGYRMHFPQARHVIVCTGKTAIGVLTTHDSADEVRLLDLALLPTYRNAGIGKHIVRGVQEGARASGKPLRLHVPKMSRAVRFFAGLNFAPAGSNGPYLKMEWSPASG